MIIKLSKAEVKVLKALDPNTKGERKWLNAREVTAAVFRKKEENLEQPQIRVVRNAFRKIVRETLVEMNPDERGSYRISDAGRKLLKSGETEVESQFERGKATVAAKKAGEKRSKKFGVTNKRGPAKKTAKKKKTKSAKKKASKTKAKRAALKRLKPVKKKAAAKKVTTKKAAAKKVTKTMAKAVAEIKGDKKKIAVEDRSNTSKATKAKANGATKNGTTRKKFKRKKPAASYNADA